MPEVAECLSRRYRALDELIKELSSSHGRESQQECFGDWTPNDPGIKLMCDFWNILKEDPDCNLSQAVNQRMGLQTTSEPFKEQSFSCYMAGCCKDHSTVEKKGSDTNSRQSCSTRCGSSPSSNSGRVKVDLSPRQEGKKTDKHKCCAPPSRGEGSCSSSGHTDSRRPGKKKDVKPLNEVLVNLKEAASFDKKCYERARELMHTQKELKDQILHLEHREKEGAKLLKQADAMWSSMEDAYKKRLAESVEKQKGLLKQLQEEEASANKWRKNQKDLENQMTSITKCHKEIIEKYNQKTNDLKCINVEVADIEKRIAANKTIIEGSQKVLANKKQSSDNKIASLGADISKLEKSLSEEHKHKKHKEQEGQQYVKETREDLQEMCKLLIQKKLENEDLEAEKDEIDVEINVLKQTRDQCQDRCKNKEKSIAEEIKILDKEIAHNQLRCIRCHHCTDTVDARKFCTDCPRCKDARECKIKDDQCEIDTTYDCVCMSIKEKFMDNVFDNMYTVLERKSRTAPGKAVADAVVDCLKNSRNGKLNDGTKKILQEFVLSTVKKNLNLTIIGGAVKTRCEMDPETYQQLMLCLTLVKPEKPPVAEKGTVAKKASCLRWGGTSECNCPKGPKNCPCTKRAPPPPQDPSPCPPVYEKEEDAGEVVVCPHKESTTCGPDCALHTARSAVGTDVATWRPDPCSGSVCPYSTNMRAAQCVLGPESLSSKDYIAPTSRLSDDSYEASPKFTKSAAKPSTSKGGDRTSRPRETIIEEVMGRYVDVAPIQKVMTTDNPLDAKYWRSRTDHECICSGNTPDDDVTQFCNALNKCTLIKGKDALIDKLLGKKCTHVCKTITNINNQSSREFMELLPRSTCTCELNMKNADTTLNVICEKIRYADNSFASKNITKSYGSNDLNAIGLSPVRSQVCETVEELLKDIIVSDVADKKEFASDVEWMSVEKLITKISSQSDRSIYDDSSTTTDEELRNDSLHKVNETINNDSYYNLKPALKSKVSTNMQISHDFTHQEVTEIKSFNGQSEGRKKQVKFYSELKLIDLSESSLSSLSSPESNCYVPIKESKRQEKRFKNFVEEMHCNRRARDIPITIKITKSKTQRNKRKAK